MRRALALLAVLAALPAAGCGTRVRVADQGGTPAPSTAATASTDPLALVGWWKLTSPAYGWSVGFGDEMTIALPCGDLQADWEASPSGVIAVVETSGAGACLENPPRPDRSWYRSPRSFVVVGDELVLHAQDGTVAVRMVRAPAPAGRSAPTLSAYRRTRFATPAALPAGVVPATSSSLEGRWVARGHDAGNGRGYVSFGADWRWRGSDGCNGDGGSFAMGPGGELISTQGATTLIGCDTTPAPQWVHDARRIGLQGGALVLVDVKGTVLGRLWRASSG